MISPAAAAGSGAAGFLLSSMPGLCGSRLNGLRSRADSECRVEGERERRSNLDGRRVSDSVWSNRDRLARRSLSPISLKNLAEIKDMDHSGVGGCKEWKHLVYKNAK